MIALYHGKSLLSRAIQFRTWGQYSHAAWWMPDETVIEAWQDGGVRHCPYRRGHVKGTIIDLYDMPSLTPEDRVAVAKYMTSELGKPYDFNGILGFFTRQKQSRRGQDAWFCSELVHAALNNVGKPPLVRIDSSQVYPTLLSYSPMLVFVRRLSV